MLGGKVGLERVGDEYEQDTLNKCYIWNVLQLKSMYRRDCLDGA